ncbi:UNVERIFIED_CONTAM: Alpha-xylosidase 1 [Sesamum latifolium]|uniref:Alpha-xylosidase 1 n=1 Tax=Sesamum latifolium TaxID=2727402 RepID=A0AAW2X476_9LAMI
MFFFPLPPLLSSSFSRFLFGFLIISILLPDLASSSSSNTPTKIGKGYRLISIQESPNGGLLGLLQVKQKNNIYGPDIPPLQLYVKHETDARLRVHITDAEKQRWEVPYNLLPRETPPSLKQTLGRSRKDAYTLKASDQYAGKELIFSYTADPFSFSVKRKSNGQILFDSNSEESDPYNDLVFKDQYLELSTKLPKDASLYGLGENTQPHGIKLYPNEPYTLYTTDISAINLNADLGNSLTYKVIGGVFDLYFFSGPSPLDVVDQYTSFIGRPAAMPYWAFGFHQCRWGYHNLSVVEDVVENYKKAKIPLDVIWNDDDHMDGHKDFTLNPVNYPRPQLLAFLDKIHAQGMKYIVIIDPGIGVNKSYGVYQRAIADDVFIKYEGKPYLAQVWPGAVNFPDFLNPKTVEWWGDEIRRFHELVPVDGLWIDMNEASNFCTGLCTIPEGRICPNGTGPGWECCLDCKNITKTRWDDPPYKINASGIQAPVGYKTIATSAYHYTRSHYAAHWTGDNKGTWEDLRYSISTMLNFGIFGVPMVGSDICGFYPAPTEELCNRWIEVGAFYPFSRDHANFYSPRQELYQWESVAESARNALGMSRLPTRCNGRRSQGEPFLDEDELPEMKLGNGYSTYVDFYATVKKGKVKIWSDVQESKFALEKGWKIEKVAVLGLQGSGSAFEIEVNGNIVQDTLTVEINTTEHIHIEELEESEDKMKNVMVEVKGLELPVGKNFQCHGKWESRLERNLFWDNNTSVSFQYYNF